MMENGEDAIGMGLGHNYGQMELDMKEKYKFKNSLLILLQWYMNKANGKGKFWHIDGIKIF